jgi:hypothetical protein
MLHELAVVLFAHEEVTMNYMPFASKFKYADSDISTQFFL